MGPKRMLAWAALALVCTTPAAGPAEPFVDAEAGLTSFGYAGRVRLSSPVALGPWRDGAPRLGGAAPADLALARVLALALLGGLFLNLMPRVLPVLALSGRLERLALSGAGATAGSGSATATAAVWAPENDESVGSRDSERPRSRPPARAARASAVPASAAPVDEDSESLHARSTTASPEALLASLSSQARYAPVQDASGTLRGLALLDVRPDSALERIGLRSGDVVVSVAGVKLAQGSRALDALRGLDPRSGAEVLIERQGVPTRIAVPPGAL